MTPNNIPLQTLGLLLCLLIVSPVGSRTFPTNGAVPGQKNQTQAKPANEINHSTRVATNYNTNSIHLNGNSSDHGNSTGSHGNGTGGHGDKDHSEAGHHNHGIIVAGWNWDYVKQPFIITMFLIAAAILKLGFHHVGRLPQILPESCLLIGLGTIVGSILYATKSQLFAHLQPSFFFLVLLPPIILESSYSLYDRVFFDNLGTILLFAVVGTILNCFMIGPALYGLAVSGAMGKISISFIQCLVFSSLIVAVDPVAVLAIFQEIGVNNVLYFLVFGESLLNDAVTVVLYNMMKAFNGMETIPASQILKGIASFFSISLIGMIIGIIYGLLTALITKYTEKVRVVEPLAIFTFAYASYLTADLFEFSGIISILSCGLVQAHFAFHNVSHKSLTTVLYFSKIVSTTSDCIIFLFLGLALVKENHVWHPGFILWTIILCLIVRFIGVYVLTFLANRIQRVRKIDFEEQFIMAYGGLRGAVAFSLVAMLQKKSLPDGMREMFETTTLIVVLFTVFVQGITIKPLVNLLRIRKQGEKVVSLCDAITDHVIDHVMAGIEEIVGSRGRNTIREMLDHFDDVYLKWIFQRDPMTKDQHIMELYKEIAIQDHYDSLANNVDMGRYSSQMHLYHSCVRDENDDTFISLAKTHHELADRALDTSLRRRSLLARTRYLGSRTRFMTDPGPEEFNVSLEQDGGVGVPRKTTSLTKESSVDDIIVTDFRKWLVKPSKTLHQKYDRNLNVELSQDLVGLLQEKQRRTTRYIRSISMSHTPEGTSPAGSSQSFPFTFPQKRPTSLSTIEEARKDHGRSQNVSLLRKPGALPQAMPPALRSVSYAGQIEREPSAEDCSPKLASITEIDKQSHPCGTSSEKSSSEQCEAPNGIKDGGHSESLPLAPQAGVPDIDCKTRRTLLARQDKVSDFSPARPPHGIDVTDRPDVALLPRSDGGQQKPQKDETQL